MAHLYGVDRRHTCQLRLRPAALIARRRTLVRQQVGTQPYQASRQIRERRLETDQRSDGQRLRVQYDRSVAASTVLAGRLRMTGGPAEQRPQRHILAERHQPRLRVRAAHTGRPDEHRRLVDPAVASPRIDVDQQICADLSTQLDQARHGIGVAGQIDADAALTPDHEVNALACQLFGERLTGGLTFRRVLDVTGLDERDPNRRRGLRRRTQPEPCRAEGREDEGQCNRAPGAQQDRSHDRGVDRDHQEAHQPHAAD